MPNEYENRKIIDSEIIGAPLNPKCYSCIGLLILTFELNLIVEISFKIKWIQFNALPPVHFWPKANNNILAVLQFFV